MPTRVELGLGIAALALAAVLCPSLLEAQVQPAPRDRAAARDLFRSGVEASRRGDWEQAREAFARSYDLSGRTTVLVNLAAAQRQTGRLVEAAESYRRFLREAGDRDRTRYGGAVQAALDETDQRIARLRITRDGGLLSGDVVELDGEALRASAIDVDLPVNPGEHEIRVVRDGEAIARSRVTLEEAERRVVTPDVPAVSDRPSGDGRWSAVADRDPLSPDVLGGSESPDEGGGLLASPWFWTAVVVLVAGAAVTAWWLLREDAEPGASYSGSLPPGRWTSRADGFVGTLGPGWWESR